MGIPVLAAQQDGAAPLAADADALTLRAWVTPVGGGEEVLLQDGTAGELLTPGYWAEVLRGRGELRPGTVLISGTIPMREGVDQFAARWRVELADPATGNVIALAYDVVPMPEPAG